MDDKYSSVDAVLNCSPRASALEESGVQILLFFRKGVGVGGGGGGDTNRLGPKRLQVEPGLLS